MKRNFPGRKLYESSSVRGNFSVGEKPHDQEKSCGRKGYADDEKRSQLVKNTVNWLLQS